MGCSAVQEEEIKFFWSMRQISIWSYFKETEV
jgi:hypothetical protein